MNKHNQCIINNNHMGKAEGSERGRMYSLGQENDSATGGGQVSCSALSWKQEWEEQSLFLKAISHFRPCVTVMLSLMTGAPLSASQKCTRFTVTLGNCFCVYWVACYVNSCGFQLSWISFTLLLVLHFVEQNNQEHWAYKKNRNRCRIKSVHWRWGWIAASF